MQLQELLTHLENKTVNFTDVLQYIDTQIVFQPTAFRNGAIENKTTENQGSAKVFSFAKSKNLSKEDTLRLFAEHYHAVLTNPDGHDHQNIRQFIQHGWSGISFL